MVAALGLKLREHVFSVPLDHAHPDGEAIELFAREVVAVDKDPDELPWLLFLQGGPGGKSPRPTRGDGWIKFATQSHRVLLLDQRGTGRSTPLTARTVAGLDQAAIAAYLRHFRADSIVADAEMVRSRLLGNERWDTLGQSYGGFLTFTYLSRAPHGLRTCYVTGGIPGLSASADEVYARTFPRVAARNEEYYRRHPGDAARVRAVADYLENAKVLLPDGDQLTVRRLQTLGAGFGMGDGLDRVHWLFDDAWHRDHLSDRFCYDVMAATGFLDGPVYALQEFVYGQGGATAWAAHRAREAHPEFAEKADPLLFTGEMMFPWMFEEIRSLRPFAEAADVLADADDWPPLYDVDRLANNEVPVFAAVYHDDLYVDAELQLETAAKVPNTRVWVTNEYEHDGLRESDHVIRRLFDMAAGRC